MRHPGDREGHGASPLTWSGCILNLCRGESQAKICKHMDDRSHYINRLERSWTFASPSRGSQDLPPYFGETYAENPAPPRRPEREENQATVAVTMARTPIMRVARLTLRRATICDGRSSSKRSRERSHRDTEQKTTEDRWRRAVSEIGVQVVSCKDIGRVWLAVENFCFAADLFLGRGKRGRYCRSGPTSRFVRLSARVPVVNFLGGFHKILYFCSARGVQEFRAGRVNHHRRHNRARRKGRRLRARWTSPGMKLP